MFVYDELTALDLLDVNLVNLDRKTASFSLDLYFKYLCGNSESCTLVRENESVVAYIVGFNGLYRHTEEKYTHITAVSVSPAFRKCSLGSLLVMLLEMNGESHRSSFIDLYVRVSNYGAIRLYKRTGYSVHNTIENYYSDPNEDGYDMRKYFRPAALSNSAC